MTKPVAVKICGLRHADEVRAAADAGARYVGLNFFAKSPRSVSFDVAHELSLAAPPGLAKVALVVDADDVFLDELTTRVALDMLQLHGHEAPGRVADIRARYGLPVMKAVGVAEAEDLAAVNEYEAVADQILIDAKPPRHSELPGGNGLSFDWRLVTGRDWQKPWMLAGGLTPENVAEAIEATDATQVDVASGVETAPGVKSGPLIRAFVAAARS